MYSSFTVYFNLDLNQNFIVFLTDCNANPQVIPLFQPTARGVKYLAEFWYKGMTVAPDLVCSLRHTFVKVRADGTSVIKCCFVLKGTQVSILDPERAESIEKIARYQALRAGGRRGITITEAAMIAVAHPAMVCLPGATTTIGSSGPNGKSNFAPIKAYAPLINTRTLNTSNNNNSSNSNSISNEEDMKVTSSSSSSSSASSSCTSCTSCTTDDVYSPVSQSMSQSTDTDTVDMRFDLATAATNVTDRIDCTQRTVSTESSEGTESIEMDTDGESESACSRSTRSTKGSRGSSSSCSINSSSTSSINSSCKCAPLTATVPPSTYSTLLPVAAAAELEKQNHQVTCDVKRSKARKQDQVVIKMESSAYPNPNNSNSNPHNPPPPHWHKDIVLPASAQAVPVLSKQSVDWLAFAQSAYDSGTLEPASNPSAKVYYATVEDNNNNNNNHAAPSQTNKEDVCVTQHQQAPWKCGLSSVNGDSAALGVTVNQRHKKKQVVITAEIDCICSIELELNADSQITSVILHYFR